MTSRQIEYLKLYEDGHSVAEIARITGKNRSTIHRVLRNAKRLKCPFSTNCLSCPLPECAIKTEYAYMVNRGGVDDV